MFRVFVLASEEGHKCLYSLNISLFADVSPILYKVDNREIIKFLTNLFLTDKKNSRINSRLKYDTCVSRGCITGVDMDVDVGLLKNPDVLEASYGVDDEELES